MTFKKLILKLHLWLGLTSGLLVFIIAITGCIYAFQEEIQNLSQPFRFVESQDKPLLSPSKLQSVAEHALPGKKVHAVMYSGRDLAAKVIFYSEEPQYYYFVYINPYDGKVLKVWDEYAGFFRFIIDGHFYLWLPPEIGQPVVASATLIFFVMVISGIILWWPRNKSARKQRFSIKWNAKWKRKNYDLHNVLGFYASWIGVIFAITGLVWGFRWFAQSYYACISGGKTQVEYSNPVSVYSASTLHSEPAIDKIWRKMLLEHSDAGTIEVHLPEDSVSCIAANANPDPSTYWRTDYRYFDQYSLEEVPVKHMWGRSGNLSGSDKMMRMNYDIHVGGILGFPGKMLAFFASLIIASLPVTGFLIWWGRRNKTKITRE